MEIKCTLCNPESSLYITNYPLIYGECMGYKYSHDNRLDYLCEEHDKCKFCNDDLDGEDLNNLIESKITIAYCIRHYKCPICNEITSLNELKSLKMYDSVICIGDWCCRSPYKWINICYVCKTRVICKDCSLLDKYGFICKSCNKDWDT